MKEHDIIVNNDAYKRPNNVSLTLDIDSIVEIVEQRTIGLLDGKMVLSELVMDKLLKENAERIADIVQSREALARERMATEFAAGNNMVSRQEALNLTKVSSTTLHKLILADKVRIVHIGRNIFFDKQSLLDAVTELRSNEQHKRKHKKPACEQALPIEDEEKE